MQGLAGKSKMRFTERLTLRGVRVNQAGDISRKRIPIRDELSFADKLADAGTDHVDADYRSARLAYQFHKSPCFEYL